MIKSPLKWAGGKTRDMAGEMIGLLRVCGRCGRSGGGNCPHCRPVKRLSTYGAMVATDAFDGAEGF
ncbi:hypothetical protein [Raoultella ornithinolytica]|uniref:hypothetical protein n=1 Tax=Raoultella ornithinolytica TaxID=54291 RepID=UPI000F6C74AD|nr:Uncharacterised protein [Raoultella ornithinolytica]